MVVISELTSIFWGMMYNTISDLAIKCEVLLVHVKSVCYRTRATWQNIVQTVNRLKINSK